MANIEYREEWDEEGWVHVSRAMSWTGCDLCFHHCMEDVQNSPWTWAVGEELELVVFGDFQLMEYVADYYTYNKRATHMMLKLLQAVRVRKLNDGRLPCPSALDGAEQCQCCGGFKTATNVLWILEGIGELAELEEDIRRIQRFAKEGLREALAAVLPRSLPYLVLDIMLDHMEDTFSRGPFQEDWRFVEYKDENRLNSLYRKLSVIYNTIKNHLFVDPSRVPTTNVSDFSR